MYKIILTKQAINDVSAIINYIEVKFENISSANYLYEEIKKKINSLNEFPERFVKVIVGKLEFHRMPVGKINVFYCVYKNNHTVTIARVLYSGVDIDQVAIIN